jgi:hypothetical protein
MKRPFHFQFGTTTETESFKINLSKSCVNHQLKLEKITIDLSEDDEIIGPEDDLSEIVKVKVGLPKTFDWIQYNSTLKTKSLGRPIIHTESTRSKNLCNLAESTYFNMNVFYRSTMSFFDSMNFFQHGLVIIADRQANGKGRGGNTWLSPSGIISTFYLKH